MRERNRSRLRRPDGYAAYVDSYRHVSCSTARKLARSLMIHSSRRPSLHYGFHWVSTGVNAAGGQLRCTKSGGKVVAVGFE